MSRDEKVGQEVYLLVTVETDRDGFSSRSSRTADSPFAGLRLPRIIW